MTRLVICRCVSVSCKLSSVMSSSLSRLTRQSRKGSLPFSSTSSGKLYVSVLFIKVVGGMRQFRLCRTAVKVSST